MSVISMKQLLEAGVHFGHQTRKWNPKMSKYIYAARNNDIHIINLEQTVGLIDEAYEYVKKAAKEGKTFLFVGTKKQAQDVVKEEATRCGMFYINSRWLGGTLTNFKTIRSRVEMLKKLEKQEELGEFDLLPKKEVVKLKLEKEKLEKNLNGIKEMTRLPNVIIVIDSKKEHICIKEAKAMGIPVVGLIDTNCNPDDVDVIIPGNDDAIRSVKLIINALTNAIIEAKEGIEAVAPVVVEDENINMNEAIKIIEKQEVKAEETGDVQEVKKPVRKPKVEKKVEKTVDAKDNVEDKKTEKKASDEEEK